MLQHYVPFTIAHAAAAWPLRKAIPQLPLAPLIIGTLAPDFEFFVRLAPKGDALHSVGGLLAIGLPVSLLVWIVFRRVVRPALVDLMPRDLARAMRTESTTVLYASLAITAGGLSHIGWDYLSHHWTRLNLQDASTVLGVVVLAVWCSQWVRSSPAADPRMRSSREWGRAMRAARTMFLLCSVGGVLSGLRPAVSTRGRVGQIAVGAMLGVVLALALIAWKQRSKAAALRFSPKTIVRH